MTLEIMKLLVRTIGSLVRLVRSSVVLSVPLVGDQTVSFTRAASNRLVFARPITGPMVGHILGIILLAFLTIGSLVGPGPRPPVNHASILLV